jgi:DNA-binding IclR family transcriptional regulator
MIGNLFQAADRALQMLLAFNPQHSELSVTELAQALGVHKSTASRLAATLEGRGFLQRVPGDRTYRLGPELGRLGLVALGRHDLVVAARGIMEELAQRTGETVNLAILDQIEAVNIAQVDGPHIVGIGFWTGRRNKLHCSSNGKVLLAFAGAELGDGPYEALTPRTVTDASALRVQLEKVREQGWATALGELEEGLHSVAAPIVDALGQCHAALSVAGPSYRLPPERLREFAPLCVEAARQIGLRLDGAVPAARGGVRRE